MPPERIFFPPPKDGQLDRKFWKIVRENNLDRYFANLPVTIDFEKLVARQRKENLAKIDDGEGRAALHQRRHIGSMALNFVRNTFGKLFK